MYFRGIATDRKFQYKLKGYLFSEGYLFTGFYGKWKKCSGHQLMLVEEHVRAVCQSVNWLCSTGVAGYKSRHGTVLWSTPSLVHDWAWYIVLCQWKLFWQRRLLETSTSGGVQHAADEPGVGGQGYTPWAQLVATTRPVHVGFEWGMFVQNTHHFRMPVIPLLADIIKVTNEVGVFSFVGLVKECQN